MRSLLIFPTLLLLMILPACNSYEKENRRLNEEIKMARQENDYLKAQIVGLKKELDELSAKVSVEREALERKFDEDRRQMEMKFQEEREALMKKAEAVSKANQTRPSPGKERLPKEREKTP